MFMETVGAYEAKTHLPRLLDRVAHGETITITKHGVPVALLIPVETGARCNAKEVIDEIKRLRKGRNLGDLTIRQLIQEGRRY